LLIEYSLTTLISCVFSPSQQNQPSNSLLESYAQLTSLSPQEPVSYPFSISLLSNPDKLEQDENNRVVSLIFAKMNLCLLLPCISQKVLGLLDYYDRQNLITLHLDALLS